MGVGLKRLWGRFLECYRIGCYRSISLVSADLSLLAGVLSLAGQAASYRSLPSAADQARAEGRSTFTIADDYRARTVGAGTTSVSKPQATPTRALAVKDVSGAHIRVAPVNRMPTQCPLRFPHLVASTERR